MVRRSQRRHVSCINGDEILSDPKGHGERRCEQRESRFRLATRSEKAAALEVNSGNSDPTRSQDLGFKNESCSAVEVITETCRAGELGQDFRPTVVGRFGRELIS